MSVDWHFELENDLVYVRVKGDFALNEGVSATRRLWRDPDYYPGIHILWDLRETSLAAVKTEEIRAFIGNIERNIDLRGTGRSATVVGSDVEYGVMRMFQAHGQHLPIKIRVFRDLDMARMWILKEGEDSDEMLGALAIPSAS